MSKNLIFYVSNVTVILQLVLVKSSGDGRRIVLSRLNRHMEDYVLSRYSLLFRSDGKHYLFNTEGCFFISINELMFDALKQEKWEDIDAKDLSILKAKRVIVKRSEDGLYVHESKTKFLASCFAKDQMNLTIMPTSKCNFACPYCFEVARGGNSMSEKTIDDLLSFIQRHKDVKTLGVTWYGGEPLLAVAKIKRFLDLYRKECNLPIISHSIVTNGYLLNGENAKFLKEYGINSIQVTLDGVEENHNRTRCLLGSKEGSFSRIMENIDRLLEVYPECDLAIRVNISEDNKMDYPVLYKKLHDRWQNNRIYIYPGILRIETSDNCSMCSSCIISQKRVDYGLFLREQGLDVHFMPRVVNSRNCTLNHIYSYVIGPKGEIFKCWNDATNPKKIIGFIDKVDLSNTVLFFDYLVGTSVFDDPKCVDCKILPICDGLCAWYRYRNKYQNAAFDLCCAYENPTLLKKALLSSLTRVDSAYPQVSI